MRLQQDHERERREAQARRERERAEEERIFRVRRRAEDERALLAREARVREEKRHREEKRQREEEKKKREASTLPITYLPRLPPPWPMLIGSDRFVSFSSCLSFLGRSQEDARRRRREAVPTIRGESRADQNAAAKGEECEGTEIAGGSNPTPGDRGAQGPTSAPHPMCSPPLPGLWTDGVFPSRSLLFSSLL